MFCYCSLIGLVGIAKARLRAWSVIPGCQKDSSDLTSFSYTGNLIQSLWRGTFSLVEGLVTFGPSECLDFKESLLHPWYLLWLACFAMLVAERKWVDRENHREKLREKTSGWFSKQTCQCTLHHFSPAYMIIGGAFIVNCRAWWHHWSGRDCERLAVHGDFKQQNISPPGGNTAVSLTHTSLCYSL